MNEAMTRQLDQLVKNIEARSQSEKLLALTIVGVGLVMLWLTLVFDPLRAEIATARTQINNVTRQIEAQQLTYASMLEASQQDPSKFANDRLTVISREQVQLDQQIADLAGDLVTPNQMTEILTTVLERQEGLELVYFQNKVAKPLRAGVSNAGQILAQTGAVNFDEVVEGEVSGQVFEHGLVIEFEGDFFSTLKYLRFLEQVTGSFFWDTVSFRQLEWPNAHVTLEIHTLSTNQGFIGV